MQLIPKGLYRQENNNSNSSKEGGQEGMEAARTAGKGVKGFYNGVTYVLEIEPVLTIRRIIWMVLGGWVVAGMYLFAGLILCLTIVGIPMGLEAFRWAMYVFFIFFGNLW